MSIDISKYSDLDLALMVICGYLGSGAERRIKLGSRYIKVQAMVNQIVRGNMPLPEEKGGYSKEDIREALQKVMPDQDDISAFISEILGDL